MKGPVRQKYCWTSSFTKVSQVKICSVREISWHLTVPNDRQKISTFRKTGSKNFRCHGAYNLVAKLSPELYTETKADMFQAVEICRESHVDNHNELNTFLPLCELLPFSLSSYSKSSNFGFFLFLFSVGSTTVFLVAFRTWTSNFSANFNIFSSSSPEKIS